MPPDPKPDKLCRRGHPLADARIGNDGRRHCRECSNLRNREFRERKGRSEAARERERAKYQAEKGGPKTVLCIDCQAPVTVYSDSQRKRCEPCRHLRYHAPKLCSVCGTEFLPGHNRRKTCSRKCFGAKMSADRGGDGNPSYRTGKRVGVHIPGWRLQAKGESSCRNCGSREGMQLHHIVPRGKWKGGTADLRNALPLCFACHHGWHSHKVTIYREILSAEEWEFVSGAQLTGQRIEAWLDDRYPAQNLYADI